MKNKFKVSFKMNNKPIVKITCMLESVSQSQLLSLQLTKQAIKIPEDEVQRIVKNLVYPETLPPTKSFQLYYVRGVGNDNYLGGENKDVVIYAPEFVYLLDVGYPTIPAVVLGMKISGLGDPYFPDFSSFEVRSVLGWSEQDIIFPSVTGNLLITVQPNTDEETVKNGLASYATSIDKIKYDTYIAKVKPFHETVFIQEIEKNVPFVKYAVTDGIVRLIDFQPGWFIDRVC